MKHSVECKCAKCESLDLRIQTRVTTHRIFTEANKNKSMMSMENFLESSKYTKIFNTVVQKDELMYGHNLKELPQLDELKHL